MMLELVLVFVMLTTLAVTGAGRLDTCIRLVGFQGAALGLLPVLLAMSGGEQGTLDTAAHTGWENAGWRVLLLALVGFVLKGLIFPGLLLHSLRAADVRHDVEPVIGFGTSLMAAVLILAGSFWLAANMKLPHEATSKLILPAALSTTLIGLLIIVIRRTAITQTVGYLVMENGIYIFGIAMASEQPFLVEMGVLLDVFVAVFVMGIIIFHISRDFDERADVDQLSELKD